MRKLPLLWATLLGIGSATSYTALGRRPGVDEVVDGVSEEKGRCDGEVGQLAYLA